MIRLSSSMLSSRFLSASSSFCASNSFDPPGRFAGPARSSSDAAAPERVPGEVESADLLLEMFFLACADAAGSCPAAVSTPTAAMMARRKDGFMRGLLLLRGGAHALGAPNTRGAATTSPSRKRRGKLYSAPCKEKSGGHRACAQLNCVRATSIRPAPIALSRRTRGCLRTPRVRSAVRHNGRPGNPPVLAPASAPRLLSGGGRAALLQRVLVIADLVAPELTLELPVVPVLAGHRWPIQLLSLEDPGLLHAGLEQLLLRLGGLEPDDLRRVAERPDVLHRLLQAVARERS